jgi:hypothetical protein
MYLLLHREFKQIVMHLLIERIIDSLSTKSCSELAIELHNELSTELR